MEKMARNVSVYSVYNAAGTYYFGSDRANPLDTNYPYSNAMLGSIFAYGDDNTKLVNHARYTQIEWYLQDTWKASRRLTFDYGLRFYRVGDLNSQGANLGLFNAAALQRQPGRTVALPGLLDPVTTTTCPTANKIAINPQDRRDLPLRPAGHVRHLFLCRRQSPCTRASSTYNTHFFNVAPIQVSARASVSRGTCSATARPPCAAASASRGPQLDGGLHRRAQRRPGPDDGAARLPGAHHRLHQLPEPGRSPGRITRRRT